LLSPKYQAKFGKLGALSGRKDASEFTEHPLARAMLDVLAEAEVVVPPPDTGFRPDQANVFYGIVGKLLTGQRTPREAVDQWNRDKATLARKGL
jgi:ABC-type glycerol-3-phosphate transport system substrate-binding protein